MSRKVGAVGQKNKTVQAVTGKAQVLPEISEVSADGLDEFSALVEQIAASFTQIAAKADSEKVSIKISLKQKSAAPKENKEPDVVESELKPTHTEKKAEKAVEQEVRSEEKVARKAEKEESRPVKEEKPAEAPAEEDSVEEHEVCENEAPETEEVSAPAAQPADGEQAAASSTATAAAGLQQSTESAEQPVDADTSEAEVSAEEAAKVQATQTSAEESEEEGATQADEAAVDEVIVSKEAVTPTQKQTAKAAEKTDPAQTAEALSAQAVTPAAAEEQAKAAGQTPESNPESAAGAQALESAEVYERVLANKLNLNPNVAAAQAATAQSAKEKAPIFNETAYAATANAREVLAALASEPRSVLTMQAIKPVLEASAVKQMITNEAKEQPNLISNVQQIAQKAEALVKNGEAGLKAEVLKNAKATQRVPVAQAMEKVEAVLKEAARSRDGTTISMRLDPPNLGSLKVDVTFRDGTLHARLVAEAPAVNNMLRERSHELQSLLRKVGVDIENVKVSISSGQNFESNFNSATGSQNGGKHEQAGNTFSGGSFASGQTAGTAHAVESALDHWVA